MLRASRLALVGAAAAAIGDLAIIASRADTFAPVLIIFIAAGVLFIAAARALEADPRRGRLLAWAGAAALGGVGTLAGFGAGDVTFPTAGLGVVAAWLTALTPWSRRIALLFGAYLVAGLALFVPRFVPLLALPWLLPSVLIWPLSLGLPLGGGIFLIFLSFGAAIALTAAAFAPTTGGLAPPAGASWGLALAAGAAGGAALVALEVVLALARPNTSARFELSAVPLLIVFAAGALAGGGALLVRAAVPGALLVTMLGGAAAVYIIGSRPTVE